MWKFTVRILVFSERLAPPPDEGIKKLALSLAAALRGLGHDVLTLTSGGADWPELGVANVRADRLLRSRALAERGVAFGPDWVLYVPTASLTLASGLRARMLKRHARGAPVILIATQGRRHNAGVRLAARFSGPDLCVVQSRHTAAQAQALGWRTAVLPPGVDLNAFQPVSPAEKRRLRRTYDLPEEATVVLHVGHLNRQRGVASLKSLAGLALPVLAASTTTTQDAVLAAELRAADVRLITRYVAQVSELYQAADVYLFTVPPNPNEPSSIDWPLSVLEAAASDLPILATRFGALPEVWSDRDGVVFYDDEAGLRAGLLRLRQHPAHTRPLAEPFSWENMARRILAEIPR
jgi:glycosyltransferase involved in cell wall biosynthesis